LWCNDRGRELPVHLEAHSAGLPFRNSLSTKVCFRKRSAAHRTETGCAVHLETRGAARFQHDHREPASMARTVSGGSPVNKIARGRSCRNRRAAPQQRCPVGTLTSKPARVSTSYAASLSADESIVESIRHRITCRLRWLVPQQGGIGTRRRRAHCRNVCGAKRGICRCGARCRAEPRI